MEYMYCKPDSKDFPGVLPKRVIHSMNKKNSISFLAIENGVMQGIAVYEDYPEKYGYISLVYVFVVPEKRRQKIASQLLEYSDKILSQKGFKGINVKVTEDKEQAWNIYDFLRKVRFFPMSVEGHFVSYFMQDLKETLFATKIKSMQKIMESVRFLSEVPKPLIKEFVATIEESGRKIDIDKIDPLFASFFIEEGKIKGFMHLEEIEENVMLLSDTYIDKNSRSPYILPALLANALKVAMPVMPDETMLFLCVMKQNDYKGIINSFGEPEHDDLMQEYLKLL